MAQMQLSNNSSTLIFSGGREKAANGFYISKDGIEGWKSSPDKKTSIVERDRGNGAYAITADQVTYAARVVTAHFVVAGDNRKDIVSGLSAINAFTGQIVTLRVTDDGEDTFVTGFITVDAPATYSATAAVGSFTLIATDPRRLSWSQKMVELYPYTSGLSGGLIWGTSGAGLAWPLSYGTAASDARNVGFLTNAGSSTAFPAITVNGSFVDGVTLTWDNGAKSGAVTYSNQILGAPLVLGSFDESAKIGGIDHSEFLASRGFPTIPPGGSVRITLQSSGTGWAVATLRDTYI